MRTTIVFFAGVIASILVAAAAFRGGTPADYTFTYQGQLRNAGALVNGPVELSGVRPRRWKNEFLSIAQTESLTPTTETP